MSHSFRLPRSFFSLLMCAFLFVSQAVGQERPEVESIRIFLDCSFMCDTQYITNEFPIVDFVTERTQANAHM